MTKYSYSGAHKRVGKKRGKPNKCSYCGQENKDVNYEWASISKDYDNIKDYIRLCRPCHAKFDNLVKNFKNGKSMTKERSKYMREWRLKNIDERRKKEREKARRWRKENPEKARKQDKIKRERYKKNRKAYAKDYYKKLSKLQDKNKEV